MAKVTFIGCLICFLLGAACAGIIYGYLYIAERRRSAGEVAELSTRYDQLNREYTERQCAIANNVEECLGYVGSARAIIERTGGNAGRAIGNLQEAAELIKQGIAEKQALKVELDNLRASLHRLGVLGGLGAE